MACPEPDGPFDGEGDTVLVREGGLRRFKEVLKMFNLGFWCGCVRTE